jgi:hypothetical protein
MANALSREAITRREGMVGEVGDGEDREAGLIKIFLIFCNYARRILA